MSKSFLLLTYGTLLGPRVTKACSIIIWLVTVMVLFINLFQFDPHVYSYALVFVILDFLKPVKKKKKRIFLKINIVKAS